MQAALIAVFVWVAFIDAHMWQTHIFRPIFVGPVVGLIMGDLQTGLVVGATVELMFLAVIFVGTAIPPNPTISTAIATAFAVLSGGDPSLAIAAALPIALIGQIVETVQNTVVNVFFMHRCDAAAAKSAPGGIIRNNTYYPMLMNAALYALPTFLAIYFGAGYVQGIIDAIPEKVISGLAVGGGLIGAVGFALLLKSIKSKALWPFFFIGFFFAAYMHVNMIGIGMLAVICVALFYLAASKADKETAPEIKPAGAVLSDEAKRDKRRLTKKDLWKIFHRQMGIRCANNFERQQNAGFTEAMIPVIEKVYTEPSEKKAAYERHMELFLTQDMVAALPVGVAAAMEERYAIDRDIEPESINAVKTAMMGPLAGLGDSLINGTARPVLAGIACSLALAGHFIGPVLFVAAMAAISLGVRYLGVFKGYRQGIKLVSVMQSSGIIKKLSDLAAVAAYIICGGFISAIVYVNIPIEYVANDTVIKIQETLDGLLPGLIPLLFTALMYWLMKKKNVSPVILMFLMMAIGIAGVYLGVLA
jgi:mannose/fructose/N-acetylgalactosamine-specific phosphotransferase system component IID/mannose/fructose/N-acetylgalactosamine-specific phosphotransferase system component IIC